MDCFVHFLPKVAFLYTSFLLIKKKKKKEKKKEKEDVCGLLGVAVNGSRPILWAKELGWEALASCFESYSVMLNVDSVERM